MTKKLVRPADLPALGIRLSNKQLGRLEALGEFPKRVRLSARSYAYAEAEVDEWIVSRIQARDDAALL
jgi:predicted DNA-binding transcriptional regulator AlpA